MKLGIGSRWTADALERELAELRSKRPFPALLGLLELWLERHKRKR